MENAQKSHTQKSAFISFGTSFYVKEYKPSPCMARTVKVSHIDVRILRSRTRDHNYELLEDVEVRVASDARAEEESYKIPKGFVTNFGSSPRLLWSIIAPTDILVGSLVHDYLYSKEGARTYRLSRKQADKVLKNIVSVMQNKRTAWACYRAVRLCGAKHYCVT